MTIGGRRTGIAKRVVLALVPVVLAIADVAAAQTHAGTPITNVAAVNHDGVSTPSNAVTLIVAERLDLTLAHAPDADGVAATGEKLVAVTLVNAGNGDEAFAVAARIDAGGATIGSPLIAAPGGAPVPLVDGRTPVLAPGASLVLLIPVSAIAPGTTLTVSARAATGSGSPGTIVPGAGDGGGDAVVGPTGAAATLSIALTTDAPPVLEKSQAVAAPDGSARPIRGARITYTLVARFAAATTAAQIVDPIPAGTVYAPGSLSLDGAALGDAGHVAGGQITVPLGAVAAGVARTLRFTVVIS